MDAHDGEVFLRRPAELDNAPSKGTGRTFWSGTVRLDTTAREDKSFALVDLTRGARDREDKAKNPFGGNAVVSAAKAFGEEPGDPFTSPDNLWGNFLPGLGVDPGAAARLTNAADAADAARRVHCAWAFFKNIFNWEGFDNKGTPLVVRFCQDHPDKAAFLPWYRNRIIVGPGEKALPQIQVLFMGHEFTHALTHATAGLGAAGEPGGLNEAMSDIFGKLIDTYARRHNLRGTWTLKATGPGIRSVDYHVDDRFLASPHPGTPLVVDTPRTLGNGGHHWEARLTLEDGSKRSFEGDFTLDNPVQQVLVDPGLESRGKWHWGPEREATVPGIRDKAEGKAEQKQDSSTRD